MSRSDEFYGAGDVSRMFPGDAPMTSVPWPTARKTPTHRNHNLPLVQEAMASPEEHTRSIDPRGLSATQNMLTRAGVEHYSHSDKLFADTGSDINARPFVFHNTKTHEQVLLSGHHRAAAALLQGRQFEATYAEGEPSTHKEAAALQREQNVKRMAASQASSAAG